MSSDIAVRVENLSKQYRIGTRANKAENLREAIVDFAAKRLRRLGCTATNVTRDATKLESIWALREVSFEINRGEVFGIIGANGAGKSTLLKVLSHITEPTSGRVRVQGRIASLLEVGTGFHPELTGRENVYLNGSILGMSRSQINHRFEEIVGFAGVESFIDTPVKRYSSGMQVRLGFGVAAHLDPDVLAIDEVLSVGDISFQRKCMGKIAELTERVRTILFVSHNMAAVRSLCDRAVWIDKGSVARIGSTESVVQAYENAQMSSPDALRDQGQRRYLNGQFSFASIEATKSDRDSTIARHYNDVLNLDIRLQGPPPTTPYNIEFRIKNEFGHLVSVGSTAFHGMLLDSKTRALTISIGPLPLPTGRYSLGLSAVDSQVNVRYDEWPECYHFQITDCRPFGHGHEIKTGREGVCVIPHRFTVQLG